MSSNLGPTASIHLADEGRANPFSRAEIYRCVQCTSDDVEGLSYFGAGEMTLQLRCRQCRTIFEAVKWPPASDPSTDIGW